MDDQKPEIRNQKSESPATGGPSATARGGGPTVKEGADVNTSVDSKPAEATKAKIRFSDDFTSPTLDIGQGEYRRTFKAAEQPFTVESEEEMAMLLGTGHFVAAPTGDKEG